MIEAWQHESMAAKKEQRRREAEEEEEEKEEGYRHMIIQTDSPMTTASAIYNYRLGGWRQCCTRGLNGCNG